jgi:predicted amidohydrolase YtcJ
VSLSFNWFVSVRRGTQKDDLEREPLLRGRPILLVRVDFHTYWVSNAILSKIDNIPDEVDGGLIVRDKAGHPTGPCRSLSLSLSPATIILLTISLSALSLSL